MTGQSGSYTPQTYTGVVTYTGTVAEPDGYSWTFKDSAGKEVATPLVLMDQDRLTISLDPSYVALGASSDHPSRFFRVMVYENVREDGQDRRGAERNYWERKDGKWSCFRYSDGTPTGAWADIGVTAPDEADTVLELTGENTAADDAVWICPIIVAGAAPTSASVTVTPPFYHPDPEVILKKNTAAG